MKAVNIQWDIDIDEAFDILDEMEYHKAAKAIGVSADRYANMTTSERHDCACDLWHHCPGELGDFLGVPNEVEIPEDITDEEDISDYLSDEYGWCHAGFELAD